MVLYFSTLMTEQAKISSVNTFWKQHCLSFFIDLITLFICQELQTESVWQDQVHDLLFSLSRGLFWWQIKAPSSWHSPSLFYQRANQRSRPNKRWWKWAGTEQGSAHLRTLLSVISDSRSGNPISHLGCSPEPSTHSLPINLVLRFKAKQRRWERPSRGSI